MTTLGRLVAVVLALVTGAMAIIGGLSVASNDSQGPLERIAGGGGFWFGAALVLFVLFLLAPGDDDDSTWRDDER